MNTEIWNCRTGEKRVVPQTIAVNLAQNTRGEWSTKPPLPAGWDREIPRYRLAMDLHPSPLRRHRLEPPFVSSSDSAMWQYAEKPLAAGEIIETTQWCHLSMLPLNPSATAVRDYLRDHMNSRLPQTPWHNGKLRLDDGLFGPAPSVSQIRAAMPPQQTAFTPTPVRVAR